MIPDSLVERLKARQAALIAGLGCAELAGAPGWTALIEWLRARLPFADARAAAGKLTAAGRVADAALLVRDLLAHTVVRDELRLAYPDGAALPASVAAVARLPWRSVVTTAYDDLWERALNAARGEGRAVPVVVGSDEATVLRVADPAAPLMHLFGRVALPETLRLGAAEWGTARTPASGLAWLADLRRRRSLVLIGFRPGDPDLAWLASWMTVTAAGEGPHFLFLDVSSSEDPDTEVRLAALRTGMNVIACRGGTTEAMESLAAAAAKVGDVPAPDTDIDLDEWLKRWAENPSDSTPRQVLERAAVAMRADEQWDRLVELLLRRLELQHDRTEQLAALKEVGEVFREALDAPRRALTADVAALRLAPTDEALWNRARGDAAAGNAWDQMVREAAEIARALETTPAAAYVWREIARVAQEKLRRPEQALEFYQQALVSDPGNPGTRDAQAELLRELGRWSDLVAVLRAAAAETHDATRAADRLHEAAYVLEGCLGDVKEAIAAYERVFAIWEGAPTVVSAVSGQHAELRSRHTSSDSAALALERLYESQGRWADLALLLDRRARRLSGSDAATIRRRHAEIVAEQLGDADAAADELEALLAGSPEDQATLQSLERIYDRAGRHEDYLRAIERRASVAASAADRIALLRRLAAEGEVRPDGAEFATRALERILAEEPRDADGFISLVRLHRATGRPAALARTLATRIDITDDEETRRELLMTLAEIYDRELEGPADALDAYLAAEKLGEAREETYAAIARLAESVERWEVCAATLVKWAALAASPELRAGLHLHAGRIAFERLGDRAEAERQLIRAVEVAPNHAGALGTLARFKREGGELDEAVTLFLRAGEHETDAKTLASVLADAALVLRDHLRQEARAVELLGRALVANPEHIPAVEALSEVRASHQEWDRLEPLLDVLANHVDASDVNRVVALQLRLADVCLELGGEKESKAIACLTKALEHEPQSLAILEKLGDVQFVRGDWKGARDLYMTALRHHRSTLSNDRVLRLMMRVGHCQAELGNVDDAISWYRNAHAIDDKHRPALEALSRLRAGKGDWRNWVIDRRALAAIAEPKERATLFEDIADVYADRLDDPAHAVTYYRAALEGAPERRPTLVKLIDAATKTKDWQAASEMLARLAKLETEPPVRAKVLYTAALIKRDELADPSQAATLLEAALDDDPGFADAWNSLKTLHTGRQNWKALARSLRRMLKRLPADAPNGQRVELLSRLGAVAEKHLGDLKLAVASYEQALAFDPDDFDRQKALADLYAAAGPDTHDKAIAAHQQILARDPQRIASVRALADLYGATGEVDAQWCIAATLSFLRKADAPLDQIYRRYRPPAVPVARHRFTEEVWEKVRHPYEDRLLGALFVLIGPFVAPSVAQPAAQVGLRRRKRVDLTADTRPGARAVMHIAETMVLPMPDVYLVEDEGPDTAVLNIQDKPAPRPTLVVGPSTLRRRSFDLAFDISRFMACLRPERFLRFALGSPAALDVAMRAGLVLASVPPSLVSSPPYGDPAQVDKLATYLATVVPPAVVGQIATLARHVTAAGAGQVDLRSWIAGADLTAGRAALLTTGDLRAAARVILSDPETASPVPAKERVQDLIAFSVTETYFAARRQLGLNIG